MQCGHVADGECVLPVLVACVERGTGACGLVVVGKISQFRAYSCGVVADAEVCLESVAARDALCMRAFGVPVEVVGKWPLKLHSVAISAASVRESLLANESRLVEKDQQQKKEIVVVENEFGEKKKEIELVLAENERLLGENKKLEAENDLLRRENSRLSDDVQVEKQVYDDELVSAEEKRARLLVHSEEDTTREVMIYQDEEVSVEEKRAEIVEEMQQQQVLVYKDDNVSMEEKRAQMSAPSEGLLNVRKCAARMSALCVHAMMEETKASSALSASQKQAVTQFVHGYLRAVQEHQTDQQPLSEEFKKFVVERLMVLLQKIRLAMTSGRRINIDCKTWAGGKEAATDAKLCVQHLKDFCGMIAKNLA